MVKPAVCVSSFVTVVFLMLKYNNCCYPFIFESTVLHKNAEENSKTLIIFALDAQLQSITETVEKYIKQCQ